jgi:hypothetical protein
MLGVKNEFPVNNGEPPAATSYQFTFPAEGVASIITGPELQTEPGVVAIIVGALLTVAVMAVRDRLVQPFAMTST